MKMVEQHKVIGHFRFICLFCTSFCDPTNLTLTLPKLQFQPQTRKPSMNPQAGLTLRGPLKMSSYSKMFSLCSSNEHFGSLCVANTRRHTLTHSCSQHPVIQRLKHKADLFTLEHQCKASMIVQANTWEPTMKHPQASSSFQLSVVMDHTPPYFLRVCLDSVYLWWWDPKTADVNNSWFTACFCGCEAARCVTAAFPVI